MKERRKREKKTIYRREHGGAHLGRQIQEITNLRPAWAT
jgi:hypothetical protein